jgi:hypothetical protein
MRRTLFAILACVASASALAAPPPLSPREAVYELRIYYPAPGKLAALNARFRNHTLKLFERHGMTNVAYWNEPAGADSPNGRVIYVLAYPSRAARDADWEGFRTDPEWQAVAKASEVDGKLVEKVDSIFMNLADYSPPLTLPR